MIKLRDSKIYNIFKEKWLWNDNSQIFLYSDPHFSDLESYTIRFPDIFSHLELLSKNQISTLVHECDQMQIDNINQMCHKYDTLIILGDVGNVGCVRQLKAGRKILIKGNHDSGSSKYERRIGYIDRDHLGDDGRYHYIDQDNRLFDEIYEGTLQISPKIILSHEPVEYKYCLNIHGHTHPNRPLTELDLPYHSLITPNYVYSYYNCCAEYIKYIPISLKSIMELGVLKDIPDIHRETIDRATEECTTEEK